MYKKGRCLEARGRYREAVHTYEQAIAHGGGSVALHQRIGRLYLQQLEDPQQAREHWCEALKLAMSPEAVVAIRSQIERLQETMAEATAASSQWIIQ